MIDLLSNYTSLRIGGKADITVVTDVSQLKGIRPRIVLGRGSKILASDEGVSRKVVVMRTSEFKIDGERIIADAGTPLPLLSNAAASVGLTGFEWACGIPASLGGAIVMNAGAFGSEISDVLESITVQGHGEIAKESLKFSYRRTEGLPDDAIIISAKLRLKRGERAIILDNMKSISLRRCSSQPKGLSAGSTFRRVSAEPNELLDINCSELSNGSQGFKGSELSNGSQGFKGSELSNGSQGFKGSEMSAGYYIERAGLKNLRCGAAVISPKHANFIINEGNASSRDIRQLIDTAKMCVKNKFGVCLKEEIIYLGDF